MQGTAWFASAAGFGAMAIFAKEAYAGGASIPTLLAVRFTLAAAVLPMLGWWLTQDQSHDLQWRAVVAGAGLALAVGLSRLLLSTHSLSEVVIGLALGALVAFAVIPRRCIAQKRSIVRWALPTALLAAGLATGVGGSGEAHGIVVQLALHLSGRTEAFTRGML